MPSLFREQPILRVVIGAAIVVAVWSLYVVRVVFGVGPSHDPQGNQAPVSHYLAGALIGTGMVAVWIIVREVSRRKRLPGTRADDSGVPLDQRRPQGPGIHRR